MVHHVRAGKTVVDHYGYCSNRECHTPRLTKTGIHQIAEQHHHRLNSITLAVRGVPRDNFEYRVEKILDFPAQCAPVAVSHSSHDPYACSKQVKMSTILFVLVIHSVLTSFFFFFFFLARVAFCWRRLATRGCSVAASMMVSSSAWSVSEETSFKMAAFWS